MLLGKDSQSHGGGEFNSVPFTTLPTHWFNGVLGGAARLSLYSPSSSSSLMLMSSSSDYDDYMQCLCSNFVYLHFSSSRTNGISRISRGLSLVSTVLSLLPRNVTFLKFYFKHCNNCDCCLLSHFIVKTSPQKQKILYARVSESIFRRWSISKESFNSVDYCFSLQL